MILFAFHCPRGPEEARVSGTRKVHRSAAKTQPKTEIAERAPQTP
jgi:hypothetical protein